MLEKLKICFISDFAKTGGAAIAADRIAKSLNNADVNVCRISSDGCKDSLFEEKVLQDSRKMQFLQLFSTGSAMSYMLSTIRNHDLCRQLQKNLSFLDPDFIYLNNLHSAGWPLTFAEISFKIAPTSWILHDCSSFLGSYYPSQCPIPSVKKMEELQRFWKRISKSNSNRKFSSIAPSNWMQKEAKSSYWKKFASEVIHYPIFSVYHSKPNRFACKKALDLDENKTTILAVAGNLDEERKGGHLLKDIIHSHEFSDSQFILLGNSNKLKPLPPNVFDLGFVHDETFKCIVYNSADLTLHCAPVDNLPNTAIESIACGTPVLAFDTGGLQDIVVPEKTGWLVETENPFSLKNYLQEIIKYRKYKSAFFTFQEHLDKSFEPIKIANEYLEFSEFILSENK